MPEIIGETGAESFQLDPKVEAQKTFDLYFSDQSLGEYTDSARQVVTELGEHFLPSTIRVLQRARCVGSVASTIDRLRVVAQENPNLDFEIAKLKHEHDASNVVDIASFGRRLGSASVAEIDAQLDRLLHSS
jgi:hypothetical protein